jgi:TolB protein
MSQRSSAAMPLPIAAVLALAACGGGGGARAVTPATDDPGITAGRAVKLSGDVITFEQDLAWSPDSTLLAFSQRRISRDRWQSDRKHALEHTQYDVFVVNADGSGLRQLTDSAEDEVWVSWYPDGRKLAFATFRDGDEAIFTLALDGPDAGVVKRLTPPASGSADAAWAPDGKRIVYAAKADAHTQLYVASLIGTDVRQLTHEGFDCRAPMWSPDGKQLVFSGNPRGPGTDDVFVLDAASSAVTALTYDEGSEIYPGWMPDGKVTFTAVAGNGSKRVVFRAPLSDNRETLVDGAFFARVSPDGRAVAYIAGAFPETSVYVRPIDTAGEPRRIVD